MSAPAAEFASIANLADRLAAQHERGAADLQATAQRIDAAIDATRSSCERLSVETTNAFSKLTQITREHSEMTQAQLKDIARLARDLVTELRSGK